MVNAGVGGTGNHNRNRKSSYEPIVIQKGEGSKDRVHNQATDGRSETGLYEVFDTPPAGEPSGLL